MNSNWDEWIHRALREEAEDPFVLLLRNRVAHGDRVVRVNLDPATLRVRPTYTIVLARGTNLSELRLPHTESFIRWCLATGTRMETFEEESLRCAATLAERLRPMPADGGNRAILSALRHLIPALGAPRGLSRLASEEVEAPGQALPWTGGALRIDEELARVARELAGPLAYTETEVASILDGGLVGLLDSLSASPASAEPSLPA
jgi:hypothetical protein